MRMLLFVLLVELFVVTIHTQNCNWSTWSQWATCSDNCGNCGTQTRSRSCSNQTAACICSGKSTQFQSCANDVCIFPRNSSCCIGQPASVDGQFKCSTNASIV